MADGVAVADEHGKFLLFNPAAERILGFGPLDVTPEELNQAVMREAMRYPGQERQVLEFYGKNAQLKEQLRAPIFEEKTVDFILELAKVIEKSVTPEELLKAARAAEEEDEDKSAEPATPAAN